MTADAYDVIRRDVLARVERRRLRPDMDLDEVRTEVDRAVDAYQRLALLGEEIPLADPAEMGERVLRSITDFGALTELIARRDVEEIFIEGARVSYLDGSGRLRGLMLPTSEDENRQIVERMLATTERQLNTKHPMVQARVLGGSARLTAAIPPVGDQLSATLRRYVVRNVTLDDLVHRDSLSREAAGLLRLLMQLRSRIAVSGEPGAGKTTLAAALLAAGPASHCVRACEEIRELAVPITHGSYYEVRPPALDGTGEISLRDLVKFVLTIHALDHRERTILNVVAPQAAIYVRISQDRAGDELGVKRQREDCVKLAKAREWSVGQVFTDDDRSAFSGKPRPAYEAMLEAIQAHSVSAVIAWHPDRLHRSPVELERFIDVVNAAGAEVATVQAGEFDLGSAAGRMVARVVGAVARHESEQKSERLRRQREQMALDGRPHGGRRAFGYDKRGSEVIDSEAVLIREAVDRVRAGESLRTIAFDWNRRSVRSTSGKPWGVTSLKSMITGPRLAGLRVHRGEVVGNAAWPAILTRDQHDAVRSVVGNPRTHKQGRPATSLLGGLIHCAKCGAKMHASTRSSGVRRYVCVVRPETNGCGTVAIQAERTEGLIVEVVMARLDTPALASATEAELAPALDDVALLEDRLAQLADAFAEGSVTKAEWMRARGGIDRRLTEARKRRDAVDARAVLAPVSAPGVLRAAWSSLDTDQRRSVLAAVIDRVLVAPAAVGGRFDSDRISIDWRV